MILNITQQLRHAQRERAMQVTPMRVKLLISQMRQLLD